MAVKKITDASGAELSGSGNVKRYQVASDSVYSLNYDLSEMGFFSNSAGSNMTLESDASPSVVYLRTYTVYNNGTEQTPIATAQLNISVEKLFELN